MKQRADQLLVDRGLAESRTRAQALILAGKVLVDGQKVEKAGAGVQADAEIRLLGEDLKYVSRGGLKLEKALEHWKIDVAGKTCLDVGASTGGFTDCLLQHGAARVIAVGRGARLQAAAKAGADVLVDFEHEEPVQAVRSATNGRGVDEAVECSGAAGTFRQAVEMVRKGGRVALLGVPPDHVQEPLPFKYIVHNEIAIFGVRANPNVSRKVINLTAAGQLQVKDLVTHSFPLENFAIALDTFVQRRGGAIKVVVEPN